MNKDETLNFLHNQIPLFKEFNLDTLSQLIDKSDRYTFTANEAIIEYGESGRFLCVLLCGSVEVSILTNTGEKHQLSVLKPGDIFGEISLMTDNKIMANVIGLEQGEVLLIPDSLFQTILLTSTTAIKILSKSITKRMKEWGNNKDLAVFEEKDDPYGFKLKTDKPMKILVINCGSSSLKYNLFDTTNDQNSCHGIIEIQGKESLHQFVSTKKEVKETISCHTTEDAFEAMLKALNSSDRSPLSSVNKITSIGHRVVHGGTDFTHPTIINDTVLSKIDALAPLAPLHNPVCAQGIRLAQKAFPNIVHVAVFDTAFHHTLPDYAYLYGLPYEYYEKYQIRKYGFHGMSHFYVALKASEFLKRPFNELEIISAHLGNGASLCAIDHGRSIDTTMGFTPLSGLIMGTRCGDVDAGALLYIMQHQNLSLEEMSTVLNKKSGLKGLSELSNDMRTIEAAAEQGDNKALVAYKTFCYQIRKTIGSYVAAMQGLDVVIFTGGIGQGSAGVRSLACQNLSCMGIIIDETKNQAADGFNTITDISHADSRIRILVIPTREELMIARQTIRTLKLHDIDSITQLKEKPEITIEVSAHHVHLSKAHIEQLFGKGYELTPEFELSQPGQYAAKESVTLIGPKGSVERVRILGPARQESQVEISMTEQFKLGITPPIRESGDISNTPGITLGGPQGKLTLEKGIICAQRHIHMSPEDALQFGLHNKYKVLVKVRGDRELIFGDVIVRVSPKYKLAMHIDTDEANAANIKTGTKGIIEAIQNQE